MLIQSPFFVHSLSKDYVKKVTSVNLATTPQLKEKQQREIYMQIAGIIVILLCRPWMENKLVKVPIQVELQLNYFSYIAEMMKKKIWTTGMKRNWKKSLRKNMAQRSLMLPTL